MLRLIFAFLPVLLVGCSVFFASRYPLDRPAHARLNALLVRRRRSEAETPETVAEAAALERLLIG